MCFLVGDSNLNLIDYQSNPKVRDFVNLIFQHILVPTVNKPTRVTKNNAALIELRTPPNNTELLYGVFTL